MPQVGNPAADLNQKLPTSTMARRPKTSPAEELIHLAAAMPWWACLGLAVISYLVLHAIAGRPIVLRVGEPPAAVLNQSLWSGFAAAGQFIVPIVLLAAAVVSAIKRRRRTSLFDAVNQPDAASALDGLSWRDFEILVSEAYRRRGYQVQERGGAGPDGGVDLVLTKPSTNGQEKVFVQCKHWRAYRVGVDVVRQLYGVMAGHGATAGIVVSSGRFTPEAAAFAQGRNVTLLDGPQLRELIGPIASQKTEKPVNVGVPQCPACAKSMVRRTAKKGANAGDAFWGCSSYPACKGTRTIR